MNESELILIKQAIDFFIAKISQDITATSDAEQRENLRALNMEYYKLLSKLKVEEQVSE